MKAVVQRVTRASVTVGEREVSSIGRGLCVLLGITRKDSKKEAEWMARKLLNLRLFEDPTTGKGWEKSVSDLGLEVLCVSQFTLCHVLKGNKPDFHDAMNGEKSQPMYEDFLKLLGSMYKPEAIKGGEFGAIMQVHIQNDGPVTLQFETPNLPPAKERKPNNPPGNKKGAAAKKEDKNDTGSKTTEAAGQSSSADLATAADGLKLEDKMKLEEQPKLE